MYLVSPLSTQIHFVTCLRSKWGNALKSQTLDKLQNYINRTFYYHIVLSLYLKIWQVKDNDVRAIGQYWPRVSLWSLNLGCWEQLMVWNGTRNVCMLRGRMKTRLPRCLALDWDPPSMVDGASLSAFPGKHWPLPDSYRVCVFNFYCNSRMLWYKVLDLLYLICASQWLFKEGFIIPT